MISRTRPHLAPVMALLLAATVLAAGVVAAGVMWLARQR